MDNKNQAFIRWYDKDATIAKCVELLKAIPDPLKRQTATFIIDEIITKKPYNNMLPAEIFDLITSETRKRRWYDFDEAIRIFIELLRHSSTDLSKEIAIKAIHFIENQENPKIIPNN